VRIDPEFAAVNPSILRAHADAELVPAMRPDEYAALLADMEKAKGVRLGGNRLLPPGPQPRLSDLGVSKMDSSRWQAMAVYGIQSKDESLQKMAVRIRARAIRRAGELLQDTEPSKGGQPTRGGDPTSRRAVAERGRS
jgi:hypothetical protein